MKQKHGIQGSMDINHQSKTKSRLMYTFKLGRAKRNGLFIALEEIDAAAMRKFLNNIGKKRGENFGHATLAREGNKITWRQFYPLGSVEPKHQPRGRGLGSRVQHAIVEHLAENYPGHLISHPPSVSPEMEGQFRAIGIDPNKEYRIEKYRGIMRRYIARKFGVKFK